MFRERNAVPALMDPGSVVFPGSSSLIFSTVLLWALARDDAGLFQTILFLSMGQLQSCSFWPFHKSCSRLSRYRREQSLPPGKTAAGGSKRGSHQFPLGK